MIPKEERDDGASPRSSRLLDWRGAMSEDCPICQGSRKIRLPLRQRLSVLVPAHDEALPTKMVPSSKEFPCPECGPKIPEERVAILEFGASMTTTHMDATGYEEAARRQCAHQVVDALLGKGFIHFSKGPVDEFSMRFDLTGRLGVVSTAVVASMEERIADRQNEVAHEVVHRAAAEVRGWAAHYTGVEGNTSKGQAVSAIRRAAEAVLQKRGKAA